MRTFARNTIAMPAIVLAVAGCNDTLPDKTGNSFGQLSLTGVTKSGETLTA